VLPPQDLILLQAKIRILFTLVCLLWAIHAIDWAALQGRLSWAFCIRPREPWGLVGVITAHFLHDRDNHLPGNTLSLIPLGGLILLQGVGIFYAVSIIAGLIAGLGTWLFASKGFYIGASGIIFGYIGFLLVYGLVSGNFLAAVIAIWVGIQYGRSITGSKDTYSGILPLPPGLHIAWMMHLFGFIGGIVAAYLLGYLRLTAGS
jgi:membrane associated rhomboid family serine protease